MNRAALQKFNGNFPLLNTASMDATEQQAREEIARITGTVFKAPAMDVFREQLAAYINDLINHDFSYLVQLLYRLDVSEQKLKTMLQETAGTDAAWQIADSIISRQVEKINTRRRFSTNRDDIPDEDKW